MFKNKKVESSHLRKGLGKKQIKPEEKQMGSHNGSPGTGTMVQSQREAVLDGCQPCSTGLGSHRLWRWSHPLRVGIDGLKCDLLTSCEKSQH